MKKQVRYYVSRKNVLTWLAVAMSLGCVALHILALCMGEAASISTANIWFQKVLPMAVSLLFAGQLILCGEKNFFRTSTAVFWGCVYFAQVAYDLHVKYAQNPRYALFGYMRYVVVCWVLYFALYMLYRWFVCGKFKKPYVLTGLLLLPFAVLIYDFANEFSAINQMWYKLDKIANILMLGAIVTATLAMREFRDGKYHKVWGDRPDGRRLRTIDGMEAVAHYFMPNRNGASNSIQDTMEISQIERYIHQKREEGLKNFGITHVLLAAYVRTVCQYPGLNRFLSGQRVYQRDEDIQFTMAIKKNMSTDAPDTMIKLHLTQTDTAVDIYEKFNKVYEEVKSTPLDSSFDSVVDAFANIPGLILKFVVWVLKLMDYFGKLPKFLLEVSPFHASVIFTSMGSLGIQPIVHHLYDFGNIPVFVAFGRKYRKVELDSHGNPVTRRYVDFVLNTDERTVDGFYYATVWKHFRKILRTPEILDEVPAMILKDID
ncbi:MAG: hypothetical protein LBM28_06935 [Oscillospiraceae bacterium]|jgi:hypothetical protein|nr:hypothetical protein [Oscillospiraceae bacterium]